MAKVCRRMTISQNHSPSLQASTTREFRNSTVTDCQALLACLWPMCDTILQFRQTTQFLPHARPQSDASHCALDCTRIGMIKTAYRRLLKDSETARMVKPFSICNLIKHADGQLSVCHCCRVTWRTTATRTTRGEMQMKPNCMFKI